MEMKSAQRKVHTVGLSNPLRTEPEHDPLSSIAQLPTTQSSDSTVDECRAAISAWMRANHSAINTGNGEAVVAQADSKSQQTDDGGASTGDTEIDRVLMDLRHDATLETTCAALAKRMVRGTNSLSSSDRDLNLARKLCPRLMLLSDAAASEFLLLQEDR